MSNRLPRQQDVDGSLNPARKEGSMLFLSVLVPRLCSQSSEGENADNIPASVILPPREGKVRVTVTQAISNLVTHRICGILSVLGVRQHWLSALRVSLDFW